VEARSHHCQTVLWLDGPERRYLEECGAMNVFVLGDSTDPHG
jgi:branched-subunit amino acid aminotransferase/4-amino-4-deoxychorismate lyase